jgi:hypothetical protein
VGGIHNVKTVDLDCWEKFEETISSFFINWKNLKISKSPLYVSTPIFRGHVDASWKLETTLERITTREFDAEDYYTTIRGVRPAVVSITGKSWDIPENFDSGKLPPPGYHFMVYLRHHGFPSPLLDWTRSPFVAAFFAFRSDEGPKDRKVAIYSYVEYGGEARIYKGEGPVVHGLGPYVISHQRHYAQQCEYTICWRRVDDRYVYSCHEAAFGDKDSDQGELTKYTLPASERTKVLQALQRMNVTAFSLFGSEESLMETLAYQEIEHRII